MSKIQEVEFKNHLDQVIHPGDRVIAVVTGSGRGELIVGRYLGVNESGNVFMEVVHPFKKLVHKDTGIDFFLDKRLPAWPEYPSFGRYGTKEYDEQRLVYDARIEEVRVARNKLQDEEYVAKWETQTMKTTLQLNKIYPADIGLK